MSKKSKSKKPTVKITRNKNKFTISWKRGETYKEQTLWYSVTPTKKKAEKGYLNVSASQTSKVLPVLFDKFYPSKKNYLASITAKVSGRADKKTWASDTYKFTLSKLKAPKLKATLTQTNVCKFEWSVSAKDTGTYIYIDCEWETILLKNNSEKNGKKLAKYFKSGTSGYQKGTGSINSYKSITEDSYVLAGTDSYVRWFRARMRGPRGASEWAYIKHVYAKPNKAKIGNETTASENSANGIDLTLIWKAAQSNGSKPIDSTNAQYVITKPDANLTCPPNLQWTDIPTPKDTKGNDGIFVTIDAKPELDEVMFVRVNTKHDQEVTEGVPKLVQKGYLQDPENLTVVTVDATHKATITATNTSEVVDSKLAVVYKTNSGEELYVGVIPHGQTSIEVQCPNWDEEDEIAFSVFAFVGNYTKQTREDGVDIYDLTLLMTSENSVEEGGEVPKAPEGIEVFRTDVEGTVGVTWDWTWESANGVQLAWADHEDAWESTDQPDTFDVSTMYASRWNISGLEVGVTWYIRLRFYVKNGDNYTYGPWSDIEAGIINLSSAPSIPILELSDPIITENGETTASWVYVSNDKTDQQYAEIDWIDSENEYHKIAHTETAQHVVINAQEAGFEYGNTYDLVVKVRSASGRDSEWSDPVSVTIAEPLQCQISQTSLVEESIAINPRSFTGNPIEFETEMEEEVIKLEVPFEPVQDDTPWMSAQDTEPYMFRAVPTQTEDFGHESDTIVGGTVGWNQLVYSGYTGADNGLTYVWDSTDASFTINGTVSGANSYRFCTRGIPANRVTLARAITTSEDVKVWFAGYGNARGKEIIFKPYADFSVCVWVAVGTTLNNVKVIPQVIDLTAYFGSTIADYVHTLEQGTAGAGIAWLKKYAPQLFEYQTHDSGSLVSVSGLTSHDMVGKNLLDPSLLKEQVAWNTFELKVEPSTQYTASADIVDGSGLLLYLRDTEGGGGSDSQKVYSTHPVTLTSTTEGKLWVSQRVSSGTDTFASHKVQIEIGSTATAYEPYTKHSYPLDSDLTLRGIPKLDASNNLYYDGDEYKSNGSVTRKYGIVDLGTLTWTKGNRNNDDTGYIFRNYYTSMAINSVAICSKYVQQEKGTFTWETLKKGNFGVNGSYLLFADEYADAASFKTAMNGVYLVYELATSTTETADPFTNPQIVDPSGTEEYVGSPIPVGHKTTYQRICPITGWTGCEVDVSGVNVWDEEVESGGIYNDTGANFPNANMYRSKNFVEVAPNENYYLKCSDHAVANSVVTRVIYYDANKSVVSSPSGQAESRILNIPSTAKYLRFFVVEALSNYDNTLSVNYPSTDHAYHAYNGTTYPVSWQTEAGTVYGGTVDLVSGVLTVDRVSVDLGSLNWGYSSSDVRFYNNSVDYKRPTSATEVANAICSQYAVTKLGTLNNGTMCLYMNGYIYVKDSRYTDATAFKTAMNGVQLVYELATPQTYQLDPTTIQTLLGRNNVWSDGGLMRMRIAEDFITGYALKELPLEVTVTGAGDGGITSVQIKRDQNYSMERPNGIETIGYEDETVAIETQTGDDEIIIGDDPEELYAPLDDGARYKIVATVQDGLGQVQSVELPFIVNWTVQALQPSGTAEVIGNVVKITPTAQAQAGSYCEIYRLSADRPELIVSRGQFGTAYVDPYPALNEFGGHRIVFKTKNGDYIDEFDTMTVYDMGEDENDYIPSDVAIIDFDDEQIELEYGLNYSNTWDKDFKETKYLGGSIQGDWNKAISRKSNLSGAVITLTDAEKIASMRRLATFANICHVRTPDGSSFAADIQVQEQHDSDKYEKIATFTMSITRVDSQQEEGITYAQWIEENS